MDKKPFLSARSYDALKFLAQIGLPALGSLYFALAAIWGLPNSGQVVGTVTVVDGLLGALLGLSTASYKASGAKYDGEINIIEHPEKKTFSLDLKSDPEELENKKEVVFKINPPE